MKRTQRSSGSGLRADKLHFRHSTRECRTQVASSDHVESDAGEPHCYCMEAPEWLAALGPLTKDNVMDYFAESPFWDRTSTNQLLRMQTQFSMLGQSFNFEEQLKQFVGVEFALVLTQGSMYVIHKRQRSSPTMTKPIALYYVSNESVFQAPDLYQVLSARLLATVHGFRTSLDEIATHAPDFNPRRPQTFRIKQPASISSATAGREEQQPTSAQTPAATSTDMQVDNQPSTPAVQTAADDVKRAVDGVAPDAAKADDMAANSWIMARALETTLQSFEAS